jgi:alpha-beta hydrolase superfamily lysophospholipase
VAVRRWAPTSRADGIRGAIVNADEIESGRPTWFGDVSSPLFGVVHVPAGGVARAGIVICPPLGKEHVDTYRGLKMLAQQLCASGFAVLRFDYRGTGDSAESQCADTAVDDYRHSIRTAVEYLRDCGVSRIGLIGLRLGALLAADVAESLDDVSALVLWDPVTSGRRYLREQRALYKMTVGDDVVDVEGESILGITFSAIAARAMKSMTLTVAGDAATHVLLAVRPERRDDPRLAESSAAPNCSVVDVDGQAAFVEPMSFVVEIPAATVSTIAEWFDATMSTATDVVSPLIRREAIHAGWGGGRPVVETIDELGPHRLFAIRTAAIGVADDAPTLLIHNTACEHRVGSGRVWTESARELAAMGMAVVRYDRRGTGETGAATTEFARINSEVSKADVLDAMIGTGASPDRLVMTGICSGAWNSAYGALQLGARCVVLVNVILYSLRRVEVGPEKLIGMAPPSPVGGSKPEPRTARKLIEKILRRWTPYGLWLLAGRLGLTQVPEVLLKELQRKRIRADLVLSPKDHEWFAAQRGQESVSRLARTGWLPRIVTAPSGDHPLLQRDIQNFMRAQLTAAISREFADELTPAVLARQSVADLYSATSSELATSTGL